MSCRIDEQSAPSESRRVANHQRHVRDYILRRRIEILLRIDARPRDELRERLETAQRAPDRLRVEPRRRVANCQHIACVVAIV
jgi:hypothetical protein